jgi:glycerophosphoryl diester phosphodiesterase
MAENSEWFKNAPQVIAHRGASGYAPENTLAAFLQALEDKAQAVELDAKLLKDGSIIVLHDNTLDRTTNGFGSVYHFTYDEIKDLDAGSHFSSEFNAERIPRLEDVFDHIGDQLLINVELTNYVQPWDRLPEEVIMLIQKLQLESRILLSSFNPWSLIVAKRLDPSIARALLVHPGEPAIVRSLFRIAVDHSIYHPHHDMVNRSQLERLKKMGKVVNVWTVNDRRRMMQLKSLGINGIITDYPDIASEVMRVIEAKNGCHELGEQ